MSRRTIFTLVCILLSTGMLTLSFHVQPTKASGTIYIRADGSIDPPSAPINTADNVTYTFTGDINESIVVERDNIIIDGAGHLLQAPPQVFMTKALNLFNRTNIAVKDLHIANSSWGIVLTNSTNCHIIGNNITNNEYGVYGDFCLNNSIIGNSITAYKMNVTLSRGIYLTYAYNNSISKNNIEAHNDNGILLYISSNNTIFGNYIANNNIGIALWSSTSNTISGNNMTNNVFGVELESSSNNTISGNNMTNNYFFGTSLRFSHNNTISGNIFDDGLVIYESYDNVVLNNLVNGEPLVYLEEASDRMVQDAGQVILVNCNRIRVENLSLPHTILGVELWRTNSSTITGNNITTNKQFSFWGILIYYSYENTISRNNITNIETGIEFCHSSFNTVSENNIMNNNYGIFCDSSSDNSFYHNNFVENTNQVSGYTPVHANIWDNGYPSGGNYWSDYNRTDFNSSPYQNKTGSDGIGDLPYQIDANNIDNYPLMGMFSSFNTSLGKYVNIISNSTIDDIEYFKDNSTIKMFASNRTLDQLSGFCRVAIARALMNATSIEVIIDDGTTPILYHNYTLYDNGTHRWIYFSYPHSTHEIDIIPEFPSFLVLPLFMIATLLAFIVYRRNFN